ncbi:DUF6665 family protein [Rhizobium sp. RU36D]|uniref:DUF6665 family protein n=1 Tax=Rhizobium sp. RU36D TaxID=1907415 RepID=UPI0009D845A8|nr:DUF6665 family protein [Rhizobium sp. RU36D]SMD15170.1 hypothetical protein SAMN05880593_12744 [Rhizobium sp. RU36D]
MTLKPPQNLSFSSSGRFDPLAYELMAEKADALGRSGQKVEAALKALKAGDPAGDPQVYEKLLADAADHVWAFFIQREICGFRNQADAVRRYEIPAEVMGRLGVSRR